MNAVLPHRFLFRYSFAVPRIAKLPSRGRRLLNLADDCIIPDFGELDGEQQFGEIRLAWNPRGLGISVQVSGKHRDPVCNLKDPTEGDGLQIWIDTRNTQSIHRASRFCHRFCLLPTGGEPDASQPTAVQVPIARAREESPMTDAAKIAVRTQTLKDGYRLEAWLPGDQLTGFEPEANPMLGIYYHLLDSELGDQFLSVGREFPFAHDPSMWASVELVP